MTGVLSTSRAAAIRSLPGSQIIRGPYTGKDPIHNPDLSAVRRHKASNLSHQHNAEGKSWLAKVEAQEREKTGIKNLRIKFNKVFGYYLEVTNSYKDMVPDYYMRKQTLTQS